MKTDPEYQRRYFKGAVKHHTLVDAIWDMFVDPELCRHGDHERYAKDALRRALAAYRCGLEGTADDGDSPFDNSTPEGIAWERGRVSGWKESRAERDRLIGILAGFGWVDPVSSDGS